MKSLMLMIKETNETYYIRQVLSVIADNSDISQPPEGNDTYKIFYFKRVNRIIRDSFETLTIEFMPYSYSRFFIPQIEIKEDLITMWDFSYV